MRCLERVIGIVRIAYIMLIFCNLVLLETAMAKGKNISMNHSYLIVDCSSINGQVKLALYNQQGSFKVVEFINQVSFFQVTDNGFFIYKKNQLDWKYGHISDFKNRIYLASPPTGITYAAISPDGKKVLWVREDANKIQLIIRDLTTSNEHTLISGLGLISQPSWSPQSNEIAYYFVQPESLLSDAFKLNVITLKETDNEPKIRQIAKASYQSALTAARIKPPQWSPDGERLLFVANYEDSDLIRAYAYIVNINGSGLKRVEGHRWSSDNNTLLLSRKMSLSSKYFVLSRYDINSSNLSDIGLPFQLESNILNGQWHPKEQLFAFIANNNELTVIELSNRKRYKLVCVDESASLHWLSL